MANIIDKVAVITGGTSGIGLATAALLLQRGCSIALIGRNLHKGEAAIKLFTEFSAKCVFFQGNIAAPSECKKVIQDIVGYFGHIDILVNSAGAYLEKSISEVAEEEYDYIMDVNVKGTYFMCKYAFPELRKNSQGAIVNVSSDAGINGNMFCSTYCASKGAVTVLTKALALEFAPYNIRVNCVCPGDVDTPLTRKQLAEAENPDERLKEMESLYPIGRIGQAREVAEVICFLLSDAASLVTGAAWPVDGGLTAY